MYETEEILSQYLLFHYGEPQDQLPFEVGPREALDFPVRTAQEAIDGRLYERALDLGCAVGRSCFELSRACAQVVGIDFSARFIEAAEILRTQERITISIPEEGPRSRSIELSRPTDIQAHRVTFEQGDACRLRDDLGVFDLIHMANLIDRLPDPATCLHTLKHHIKPGGRLLITSPYTWLETFTPRNRWLCSEEKTSFQGLTAQLSPQFRLIRTSDMPFLIREHARKYQWSISQASLWQKTTS